MNARHTFRCLCIALLIACLGALAPAAQAQLSRLEWSDKRSVDEGALDNLARMPIGGRADEVPPLNPPSLKGTCSVQITVVDEADKSPISDCAVHGAIWMALPVQENGEVFSQRVARLESQKIKNAEGACEYTNLAPGSYEFQVEVEGFGPTAVKLKVDKPSQELVIAAARRRTLKGRLAADDTGQGIAGYRIMIEPDYAEDSVAVVEEEKSFVETNEEGRFEIEGLPPGGYYLTVLGIAHTLVDLARRAGETGREERKKLPPAEREAAMLQRQRRAAEEPWYFTDHRQVDLIRTPKLDLGDWRLTHLPIVEAHVADAAGNPGAFVEVRFDYGGPIAWGAGYQDVKTAADGMALFPLARWQVGLETTISAKRLGAPKEQGVSTSIRPKQGERVVVKLALPEPAGGSTVRLNVREKGTGKPLPKIEVVVHDNSMEIGAFTSAYPWDATLARTIQPVQHRQSEAADGAHRLEGIVIREHMIEAQKRLDQKRAEGRPVSELESDERYARLYAAVAAPGYAVRVFALPVADLQRGDEFLCEMEPEAEIRGRVLLGKASDAPATPENAAKLLGRPNEGERPEVRFGEQPFTAIASNDQLRAPKERILGFPEYREMARGPFDSEGRFSMKGLKPDDRWNLAVTVPGLPTWQRTPLRLKPGVNDLGDIIIGGSGRLRFVLRDESGERIQGAYFYFPITNPFLRPDQSVSDGEGEYWLNASELARDREIARIAPPWGHTMLGSMSGEMRVYYDADMSIDRSQDGDFAFTLPRGHDLKVKVPVSAQARRMAERYSKLAEFPFEKDERFEQRSSWAISGAAILGKKADTQGLIYHQLFRLPGGGAAIEGEMIEFTIPNVPPGPMLLRLDGGFYLATGESLIEEESVEPEEEDAEEPAEAGDEQNDGAESDDATEEQAGAEPQGMRPPSLILSQPAGFAEFLMPDGPFEVALDVAPGRLKLRLDLQASVKPSTREAMLILVRAEPTAASLWPETLGLLWNLPQAGGPDPDSIKRPIFGYLDALIANDGAARTVEIDGIVPGQWRFMAVKSFFDLAGPNTKSYYEETIEIGAGAEAVEVAIPEPTP